MQRRRKPMPIEIGRYLGEAERFLHDDMFDEAEAICNQVIAEGTARGYCPPPHPCPKIYYIFYVLFLFAAADSWWTSTLVISKEDD